MSLISVSSWGAVKKGQPFPSFDLPKLGEAGQYNSSQLKGKVVIVDFWATWCGPCKKELPHLGKLYKKYSSKGLIVLGINLDEEEKEALSFSKELGITFPSVRDAQKKLPETLGIATMPTSFILDKKGIVRFIHSGFEDGDEVKIEKEIKQLLCKVPASLEC